MSSQYFQPNLQACGADAGVFKDVQRARISSLQRVKFFIFGTFMNVIKNKSPLQGVSPFDLEHMMVNHNSSYVPCQPGHLSPEENFERLDGSMQARIIQLCAVLSEL